MKPSRKSSLPPLGFAPLLAAAILALAPMPSEGSGVSVVNLHSFDLFLNGAEPYGSVVQGVNTHFYGTSFEGGTDNAGTVFEAASNGVVNALYSFTNGVDGGFPEAGLVLANDGNFYGTTFEGGSNGSGAVFKITPAGGFTPLYSFTAVNEVGDNQDGAYPAASLIQAADGNLYGTTSTGGANGSGTLFKIGLGGSFQFVYTFSALNVNGENSEGSSPQAALIQGTDGNFYGTADSGGAHGVGTVFEYDVSQNQVSSLHSFAGGNDGARPEAALVQGTNGSFYGTASEGGASMYGALFKISSGVFTPLHSFTDGSDGANPVAPLVQGVDGNFYGTSTGPQDGFGTLFQMTTNGAVTPLYAFTGGNDGAYPEAALAQAADGVFFGTASAGGTNNAGAIFSITSTGNFSRILSFTGGNDGDEPEAPVAQGTNGSFFGTTYLGGTANDGVIFNLTTNGVLTPIYSFTNGMDGANPASGLAQGIDGNLYGTTYTGGANHVGALFRISPQGALTVLHSLTNLAEGAHPMGGLVLGSNGDFFGTTYQGGSHGTGAIFQMTSGGTVTPVYSFTNGIDGSYPEAGLAQGADGSFYGTTTLGGTNQKGTIFRITPGGVLTPLYSFTNGVDGATPGCVLAQGTDGNFYGTTSGGGAKGYGVVFQITSAGAFTALYSFTNGIDGAAPEAGLVQGTGGNLYGTTSAGGAYGMGTLFEITTGGNFAALYSFKDTVAGAHPLAPLVAGTDGNFYGTTSSGGASDGGTAFRAELPTRSAPVVTWTNPAPVIYGAVLSSIQLNARASVPGNFAYNPTHGTLFDTGTNALTVVFTPTDSVDYSSVTDMVNLIILPAALSVAANGQIKTYGQTATFAGTEFNTVGLVNDDSVSSVTLASSGAAANAGVAGSPYAIVPSAAVGTGLTNYTIDYADGTLTVNPAALSITASNQFKTYGQTITFAGTEFSAVGLLNGDTVSNVTLASSGAAVSAMVAGLPYVILPSAAVGSGLTNYTITYANGMLAVNPAALTITAHNQTKVYGQTLTFAGTEFTAVGLVNSDSVTSVTLTSSGAAATATVPGSPYMIVPGAAVGAGLANYVFTYADGSLTVIQAAPTLAWTNPAPIIYGTALDTNQLDAAVPVPGSLAYDPANATVLNTGTHTLSAVFTPSDAADYSSATDSVSLIVMPASLTVTATSFSRPFGAANPVFTGTITGLTNGDDITAAYSCSATTNTSAGTYPIAPSLVDPNDRQTNYTVDLVNGILVIGHPAEILTWTNPAPIIYGTSLTPAQLNATANIPGNYAYDPTHGATLDTGTNMLTVIFTPMDSVDYSSATDSVNLVVTPAPLTITAADTNRVYGQANPVLAGTITGVTNGDNITASYSCVATTNSSVGMYPMVPGAAAGTGLTNYTIIYSNGTLTVSPASLVITANNRTKAYGQTVTFAGTEFAAAGLVNGDRVTGVTLTSSGAAAAATATVADSPYAIVPSEAVGTGLSNYTITYVNGALTVTAWLPVIQSATQMGGSITFNWGAAATQIYQVQSTTNLDQGAWNNLGGPIAATNSTAMASDSITNSQMFYRVVLLP